MKPEEKENMLKKIDAKLAKPEAPKAEAKPIPKSEKNKLFVWIAVAVIIGILITIMIIAITSKTNSVNLTTDNSDNTHDNSNTPVILSTTDVLKQEILNTLNQSKFYYGILKDGHSCNDVCSNPSIWDQTGDPSTCIFVQFSLRDTASPSQVGSCDYAGATRTVTCVCAKP